MLLCTLANSWHVTLTMHGQTPQLGLTGCTYLHHLVQTANHRRAVEAVKVMMLEVLRPTECMPVCTRQPCSV